MFQGKSILIVEDDALIALDLAATVEEYGGRVVGPLPTVQETIELLETHPVSAAILDVQLRDSDVTPLALRLAETGVPFVLHTGTGAPDGLAEVEFELIVVMKPAPATKVIELLRMEMDRHTP